MKKWKTTKRRMAAALAAILILAAMPVARAVELRASLWLTDPSADVLYNVDQSLELLSGISVAPGEEFSLCSAVSSASFGMAEDGSGQTVYGGGLDRVATVLGRALCSGGYEILESHSFGEAFAGGYLAEGEESMRIDLENDFDLRFVNSFEQHTTIYCSREENVLHCTLVLGEVISSAPPETAAETTILIPNVNEFLSLRAEPSTSAAVLEKVLPGTRMEMLGASGGFYYVRVEGSGSVGYVHSGYVKILGVEDERWPYSYEQMVADVEDMVENSEGRLICEELSLSLDGRSIPILRFGDIQAQNHVLIQAGIHGREYITSRLIVDLLDDLLVSCPDGIDDVMFHIFPMVNPDGVVISQLGPDAINDRTLAEAVRAMLAGENANHSMWKSNARGTDLNRNFPEEWESLTGREPGSSRYRGDTPLSEPESQALAEYLKRYDFKATVSYHSYGSVIYWEGAYTPELNGLNYSLAMLFSQKCGYALGTNEATSVERGGFKDWALGTCGIPSVTIEIGAVDCFGSPDEYTGILINHKGSWQMLADWVVSNA